MRTSLWKNVKFLIKDYVVGCTGLAEKDWIGAEQCSHYKKLEGKDGLKVCKEILGIQERIKIWKYIVYLNKVEHLKTSSKN